MANLVDGKDAIACRYCLAISVALASNTTQAARGELVMRVRGGRVVLTPGQEHPYKVVFDTEEGQCVEHPVASVREGEELIKRRLSTPPEEQIAKLRQTPHQH